MRHRHEIPDAHWERIAHFFPPAGHRPRRGRPLEDHHRIHNGILWRLHTGAPWRDIPEVYGPWETIYGRFRRWRRDGTWAKILTSLLDALEQRGRLGHELWLVDATVVRASRAAAGAEEHPAEAPRLAGPKRAQVEEPEKHALGYSRGGFGTKVHLLVTDRGIVVGIYVTPGQQHESTAFQPLLRRVLLRRRPGMPYWTKGTATPTSARGRGDTTSSRSSPPARTNRGKSPSTRPAIASGTGSSGRSVITRSAGRWALDTRSWP
jgi:transposase